MPGVKGERATKRAADVIDDEAAAGAKAPGQ